MITQDLTCEHKNERPCYRTFSNGTDHFGFQCVRCGKFRTIKKDEWFKRYDKTHSGPYEPSISEEWNRKRHSHFQEQREINRETTLAPYYESKEWDFKRKARLKLNRKLFDGLCEICLGAPAVQCHHATYDRFGAEWLLDLVAVCPTCHAAQHKHMRDGED